MPTGYTADVQSGKVTSFREFAANCARAMGANILMRDDPADAPIKDYEPSTYYKDELERAKADAYDLEKMTNEEAARIQARENAERAKHLREAVERHQAERARYESMLAKVQAWTPPTPDHENFKAFMIEQLTSSISHDCYDPSDYYKPDTRTPVEYLRDEIADAAKRVARCAEEWAAEQLRTRQRNEWNRRLFESLKNAA